MAKINANYDKLATGYLFPEIARRTGAFLESHPGVEVMRLGIGDTTEPIVPAVLEGLRLGVDKLGKVETYSGYGASEGIDPLREAIAAQYREHGAEVNANEIFVSDGAKSDSANIQGIFATASVVAVQDPAYPVYVDSNVIAGRTGNPTDGAYEGLVYMPCTEENGFFPAVPEEKVDLIYLCSPNNPTGAVATKEQLATFVEYARVHQAVIIYDSAYAAYITSPDIPRSIFEIAGARECAIEINSFSSHQSASGFNDHSYRRCHLFRRTGPTQGNTPGQTIFCLRFGYRLLSGTIPKAHPKRFDCRCHCVGGVHAATRAWARYRSLLDLK